MTIDFDLSFAGDSGLVDDYLAGRGRAPRFFSGRPDDLESFREKAREVDGRFDRAARERAAALLVPPAPSGPEAGASTPEDGAAIPDPLRRWVEEGGYLVTTGQQPGLLTGPLYSVYKALTAARLARRLEDVLERPVLPVFWVAGDDHDWEEANHTHLVDLSNHLVRLEIEGTPGEVGRSLHRIPVSEKVAPVMERLETILPPTEFRDGLLSELREAYGEGATLADASVTLLRRWLGRFGVHLVRSWDPALRRAAAPLFVKEAAESEARERALTERADELTAAGYHVQVPILEGAVNLFFEGDEGRRRIQRNESGFVLGSSRSGLDRSALQARIEATPESFSPNVVLRPVVESALLPTLAYIGGPGEMAYFAQLGPVFRAHGVGMPVVQPRASVRVIEGKIGKVLDKFALAVEDLELAPEQLASRLAREEIPGPVREALSRLRKAIGEETSALAPRLKEIDTTLEGPLQSARSQAFEGLSDLEKKITQAIKREDEIALQQIEKARVHLYPGGIAQERVLNIVYYLCRYGSGFLDEVHRRIPVTEAEEASGALASARAEG